MNTGLVSTRQTVVLCAGAVMPTPSNRADRTSSDATAGSKLALASGNVGDAAEAVVFELEDPIGVVEGLTQTRQCKRTDLRELLHEDKLFDAKSG